MPGLKKMLVSVSYGNRRFGEWVDRKIFRRHLGEWGGVLKVGVWGFEVGGE